MTLFVFKFFDLKKLIICSTSTGDFEKERKSEIADLAGVFLKIVFIQAIICNSVAFVKEQTGSLRRRPADNRSVSRERIVPKRRTVRYGWVKRGNISVIINFVIKKILLLTFIFLGLSFKPVFAQANAPLQAPKQEFYKAQVVQIVEQGSKKINGYNTYYQTLRVKIDNGTTKGKFTVIQNGAESQITKDQLTKLNQEIIVSQTQYANGQTQYAIYDFYRLNTIIIFIFLFFGAVVLIAGLKGVGSFFGMLVSLGTIIFFIVPNILHGADPLTVTLEGGTLIIIVSTYLAHGISKKTTIALVSTLIALFLTAGFAILAINLNSITGLGNEDAFALQIGSTNIIDIKGLFLSGVIIATLGALNDITTTQSSTIYELKKANPALKFTELFEKGFTVGKEHIASLVNTLILAYAGGAFAVFIFFVLNPAKIPYWVILNNEVISDEVIKVIAGSVGLLLSVPIVTALAAYVFSRKSKI